MFNQSVKRLLITSLWVAAALTMTSAKTLAQPVQEIGHPVEHVLSGWGGFKVEDIDVCGDGDRAWMTGIGPAEFDDLRLVLVEGVNTGNLRAVTFVDFADDEYYSTALPSGMGPRGFPGLAVDENCEYAYVPNFFHGSVVKIDLNAARKLGHTDPDEFSFAVEAGNPLFMWPAAFSTTLEGTIPRPIDVKLTTANGPLIVSSASGEVFLLDQTTGETLARVAAGSPGSGSLIVSGAGWVGVLQQNALTCIQLDDYKTTSLPLPGASPFMGVGAAGGERVYLTNQSANTVSVLAGSGCDKISIATIPVGSLPRHLVLSGDERTLYVSNSMDNTVSVIDTQTLSVTATLPIAASGEPAPAGVLAISQNQRFLYVFWEGSISGTPGQFQIRAFDLAQLNEPQVLPQPIKVLGVVLGLLGLIGLLIVARPNV